MCDPECVCTYVYVYVCTRSSLTSFCIESSFIRPSDFPQFLFLNSLLLFLSLDSTARAGLWHDLTKVPRSSIILTTIESVLATGYVCVNVDSADRVSSQFPSPFDLRFIKLDLWERYALFPRPSPSRSRKKKRKKRKTKLKQRVIFVTN